MNNGLVPLRMIRWVMMMVVAERCHSCDDVLSMGSGQAKWTMKKICLLRSNEESFCVRVTVVCRRSLMSAGWMGHEFRARMRAFILYGAASAKVWPVAMIAHAPTQCDASYATKTNASNGQPILNVTLVPPPLPLIVSPLPRFTYDSLLLRVGQFMTSSTNLLFFFSAQHPFLTKPRISPFLAPNAQRKEYYPCIKSLSLLALQKSLLESSIYCCFLLPIT